MGVNSLPKTVTRQRRGCDLNPGRTAPESSTLTTRLPCAPVYVYSGLHARASGPDVVGRGRCAEAARRSAAQRLRVGRRLARQLSQLDAEAAASRLHALHAARQLRTRVARAALPRQAPLELRSCC